MSAPFILNNVTTADDYSDVGGATVANGTEFVRFSIQVYMAAVGYELQNLDGSWAQEVFLGPMVGVINRVARGIRFRSWVGGAPAQVTVDCLTADEVVGGADAFSPPTSDINSSGSVTPIAGNVGVYVGQIIEASGGNPDTTRLIACDGLAYLKTDTVYKALNDYLAAAGYPYGSDADHFNVPDKRERVSVGAGPNTPAGVDDGVAVTNRHATRHRHTGHAHGVTDPGHTHNVDTEAGGAPDGTFKVARSDNAGDFTVTHGPPVESHTTGITINGADGGSGNATDPLDGPAFVATNFFIVFTT